MNSAATATPSAPALPPPPDEIARRLAPLCRAHGITRLEIFGVEVDLLTRHHVDTMTNPFYRRSILRDARVIYDA